MTLRKKMQLLRSSTLERVRSAAQQGHADDVVTLGRKLARVEDLIRKYEDLEVAVERLGSDGTHAGDVGNAGPNAPRQVLSHKASGVAPRQRGRQLREDLLTYLENEGIELGPGGAVRATSSGLRVGTPYASERRPDRWFLGLPENEFDHAILICESESGEVHYLFVSDHVMRRYGNAMSRSQGQVKFNVRHDDGDFFLLVPEAEPVRLPGLDQEIDQLR